MSYCPYCGAPVKEGASYCPSCNHPLLVNLYDRFERIIKPRMRESISENFSQVDEIESENEVENILYDERIESRIRELDELIRKKETYGEPIGDLLFEKAGLYFQKRDLSTASMILKTALSNFENEGNLLNEAIAHNELGLIQEDLGIYDDAIFHFQNAIDIFKELNDYSRLIKVYNNLANVYLILNDLEHSYEYYIRALEIAKKENLLLERIKTESNLVDVLIFLKKFNTARKILNKNLRYFKENSDAYGIALTLTKFGKLYYYLGKNHFDQAINSLKECLEIIDQIREKTTPYIIAHMEWECFLLLGKIYINLGYYDEAETYLIRSLEAIRTFEFGDSIKEGDVLESLGIIYLKKEQYHKSLEYYSLALEIYNKFGEDLKNAEINYKMGNIYFEFFKNYEKALDKFERSYELYRQLNDTKGMAECLHKLGDIFIAIGDINSAIKYFEEAKQAFQEIYDINSIELINEKIRSLTNDF
ncbi:MAG: tetratricopeptide repeat protein [Promethearchaeota archaeon]